MITSICVDCSVIKGNPGQAEYRGMNLDTGELLFEYMFPTNVSNNIAEWIAIIHAMKYCKDKGFKNVKIYSDSKITINWVSIKRHKSNICKHYPELFTEQLEKLLINANNYLQNNTFDSQVIWWNKKEQGREIPADYGRK